MAALITAAALAVTAAFALGRVTSPWRPRPGDAPAQLDAAVLDQALAELAELQQVVARQQADIDVLFARRHQLVPAPLDRAARTRRAAIEASARTAQLQVVSA